MKSVFKILFLSSLVVFQVEAKTAGRPDPSWTFIDPQEACERLVREGAKGIDDCDALFIMGSEEREIGRDADEPQHRVRLTRPYEIQATEVTQFQWKKVMGSNPSYFKRPLCETGSNCDRFPVEMVTYEAVQKFIARLNAGQRGFLYRLPTEAEWEFAARGGVKRRDGSYPRFSFGDNETRLPRHAVYAKNANGVTHAVATKLPNAYGLYDMHGNVSEWVADYYHPTYGLNERQRSRIVKDPQGPVRGEERVIRGGGWEDPEAEDLRTAARFGRHPGESWYTTGFRLVREKR